MDIFDLILKKKKRNTTCYIQKVNIIILNPMCTLLSLGGQQRQNCTTKLFL